MERLRFAPSPTGPLHIGGLRTALFNYLYAKQKKGKFILRIEDTDKKRKVDGSEKHIIDSLKWTEINYDEGPGINGPFGPYRQSERESIYSKYIQILLLQNKAYYAFDLNEDLRTNAEERIEIMEITKKFQDAFTTVAKTKKPTIAAIQGFSIGGATNLVASCDIRLSTKDAKFSIGESKLGLVADVGALQRMPKIISRGLLRELAYTGKTFDAEQAKEIGFVNNLFETHEELIDGAMDLAKEIASNSPLVVKGVKMILDKGEDLTSDQSLDLVRMWSTSFLVSEDLKEGIFALMEKREPKFKGK